MSVLIRGMEMPKAGQLLQVAENVDGTIFVRETTQGEWHQVVEVPTPHGRLKDADALYEKVAGWEAQALHMVDTTMHDEDNSEWKKWSVILTERSAFKYDVEDEPTVIEAEE